MTTKADFTAQEWETLLEGPVNAGLYISLASPSLAGSISESMAVAKTIVAAAQQGTTDELLGAILSDLQNRESAKLAQPEFHSRKPDELKQEVLNGVSGAVALLNAKATPAEAQGVREWLYEVAVNAANASKEGGFLGIGGVRVSDAEKAALQELAGVLGVDAVLPG